jgi:NAD(P)-dependent dehydrogenase (short-subunit alcohol dehydrogenase family)
VAEAPADARSSVLITGSSTGIGRACALRLAALGFRVYAGVRREADGARLVDAGGPGIRPLILDVTRADQIAAAAARIDAETADTGLHGLVNNAGVAVAGPLEFLPIDEFRRQLEINVTGQIAVTQACLPALRRARLRADAGGTRPGRIVFMSSISGRSALPFTGAYAASKFALEAAADALRVELHPAGVAVSIVEPGVVATPIWATALRAGEGNLERMPAEVERYYGRALAGLRRRGARGMQGLPPDRVADAVVRALTARSPRSRYLVGRDARLRAALEWLLPTRLRDALIRAVVRRL